jgi:hypothetical protein
MTKIEYIDFIRNIVGGNHHRRQVEFAIDVAYQQIITDTNIVDYDTLNIFTKTYTHVLVSQDETSGLYYSDLPAPVMYFRDVNKGIRHINTLQGTDLQFYPMTETEWELIGGTVSGSVHTLIGYILETGKIWYYNMPDDIEEVRMRLAVPFTELEDEDDVVMPSGQNVSITQIASDILRGQPPRDTKNDLE